jgi:hypothetical protein
MIENEGIMEGVRLDIMGKIYRNFSDKLIKLP